MACLACRRPSAPGSHPHRQTCSDRCRKRLERRRRYQRAMAARAAKYPGKSDMEIFHLQQAEFRTRWESRRQQ